MTWPKEKRRLFKTFALGHERWAWPIRFHLIFTFLGILQKYGFGNSPIWHFNPSLYFTKIFWIPRTHLSNNTSRTCKIISPGLSRVCCCIFKRKLDDFKCCPLWQNVHFKQRLEIVSSNMGIYGPPILSPLQWLSQFANKGSHLEKSFSSYLNHNLEKKCSNFTHTPFAHTEIKYSPLPNSTP